MLQLYLIGPARVWLSDLEENTIFCWLDLKKAFENHFRGTYKRPATTSDLQACIQKKGETSRSFLTRWLATRNECENVDNRTAMHAFIGGLQRGGLLRHKLTCLVNANKLTLDEMINIASDHTAADDDAGGDLAATAIPLNRRKTVITAAATATSGRTPRRPEGRRIRHGSHDVPTRRSRRRKRPRTWSGAGRGQRRSHRSRIPRPQTSDHPAVIPKECYALVVSPRIDGCHIPTDDAAVLKDQIGRNVHAYIDDIAVMTRKGSDLLSDLKETFDNLRRLRSFPRKPETETLLPGAPNDGDWTEAPEGTPVPEPKLGSCTLTAPSNIKARGWSYPEVTYRRRTAVRSAIHFEATNNMAEYEALLHVRIAKSGIKHIICCGDSDLVAQQVAGTWNAGNSVMAAYRDEVDEIAKCFLGYEVKYVGETITQQRTCCPSSDPVGSQFRQEFSLSICEYPR
ncbi:hypothetical protein QYE76_068418 [Lolium multiflorum]|uniref:Retrotransposon gag domain-containing protein n=1 Tax=Lolium multiflorum TaxID=4521 RepID=A0AAD8WBX6_LOLMU|nr:hypothetical protein QYE76_068418 [Lolium multiflorum]